jgi:hypothetical protein
MTFAALLTYPKEHVKLNHLAGLIFPDYSLVENRFVVHCMHPSLRLLPGYCDCRSISS